MGPNSELVWSSVLLLASFINWVSHGSLYSIFVVTEGTNTAQQTANMNKLLVFKKVEGV